MKRFNHFLPALLLLSITFVACDKREFEIPPRYEPVYTDTATMSIADFKTKYIHLLANSVEEITDTITLSGIVVANDISGNFYKEITILDSTGGLKIAINQSDLYTEYRLGQRFFIECNKLWVGKYKGFMQIGSLYGTQIGQMTWKTAQIHIFKDKYPNPNHPLLTPEVIGMDVISSEMNLGKLVTVENVYFNNGGLEICAAADENDGSVFTNSKTLTSSTNLGSPLTVRLSSASDFANKILPARNGKLTGILSKFEDAYQITPRDSMDFEFEGFGKGYINHGLGTKADPFFANWVLTHQGTLSGWVKGYIVGTVKSGINASDPINGNEDIIWAAPFTMNNTVVIAAKATETDWTKCVVVNLPAGSSLRDSANLVDRATNKGRILAVNGTFENHLGAAGVTVATGSIAEYWMDHLPVLVDGDGTQALPYNVGQTIVKQKQPGYVKEIGKWVTGYIVGYVTTTYTYAYSASGAVTTNMLIADSPTEVIDGNCVTVQLSSGTFRDALNLSTHPENLGKKVSVKGTLEAYFNVPGVKTLTSYWLEGEVIVVDPPTIFSEPFTSSLGSFTASSVLGDQLWAGTQYGATMNGFVGTVDFANEDWLISPAINLSGKTSATLSFLHAINYAVLANWQANHTLWVCTDYTSGVPSTGTWTQVTIPTYPNGSSWTFVNSGNIALPASVLGNSNCRIAFKYLSTPSEASAWEIKTLKIVP